MVPDRIGWQGLPWGYRIDPDSSGHVVAVALLLDSVTDSSVYLNLLLFEPHATWSMCGSVIKHHWQDRLGLLHRDQRAAQHCAGWAALRHRNYGIASSRGSFPPPLVTRSTEQHYLSGQCAL